MATVGALTPALQAYYSGGDIYGTEYARKAAIDWSKRVWQYTPVWFEPDNEYGCASGWWMHGFGDCLGDYYDFIDLMRPYPTPSRKV